MWSDIQGWWSQACHEWYRRQVKNAPPEAVFVEIGCWKGRSAVSMATSIVDLEREDINFNCYDTFEGTPAEGDAGYHQRLIREGNLNLYDIFQQNIAKHGYSTVVRGWRGDSVRSAGMYGNRSVDLVFIDGDHRREKVSADVAAWLPKLRYGGVIAGHDATAQNVIDGVKDAGIPPTVEGEIWHWRKRLPVNLTPPYSALTVGPLAHALCSWDAKSWYGEAMCQAFRNVLQHYFKLSSSGISIGDCSHETNVIVCPCDHHEKYMEGDVYRRGAVDESVFPAFPHRNWPWNDPLANVSPRTDLTVGFCGAPRPKLREESIAAIMRQKAIRSPIQSSVILRDGFLGGSVPQDLARQDFINNIEKNTYQLCVRGVGNYCYRLYETLSAGRIPILVGDRPIPWDAQVNYVPAKTPEEIVPNLLDFHSSYSPGALEYLQKQNRRLWLDYLSPLGWWREWARQR